MDSPKVKVIRSSVINLLAMLGENDDETLTLDMIEGETDLFELVETLIDGIENDEGIIRAINDQIVLRGERKARIEKRIEERRKLIQSLMETAGLDKIPLPTATVWTSNRPGKLKVEQPELLTEEFVTEKVEIKPNMAAITSAMDAGIDVPGVIKTNGSQTLNIRRK